MYKIDRRGGGSQNRSLGNYLQFYFIQLYSKGNQLSILYKITTFRSRKSVQTIFSTFQESRMSSVADGSDGAQASNLEALRATGAIPKNYAGISGSDPVGSRGEVKSVDSGNRLPDSGLNTHAYKLV